LPFSSGVPTLFLEEVLYPDFLHSGHGVRLAWIYRECISAFLTLGSPSPLLHLRLIIASENLTTVSSAIILVLKTYFCSNMIAISGGNLNIVRILSLFVHNFICWKHLDLKAENYT